MRKTHYHLAATEVTFVDSETNMASQLNFNVVLSTEDKNIRITEIDHIQRQAQMLFHTRVEDPKLAVVDVLIMSISYLGHMTQEQFTYRPEKTAAEQTQAGKEIQDVLFNKKPN